MILRLDPRIPLVWRDPSSMQLGVPARVVLDDLSPAGEQMVAALTAGISVSGLAMVGESAGAGAPEIARLLDAVTPALLPEPRGTATASVAVAGTGTTADRIARGLAEAGLKVNVAPTVLALEEAAVCDLGIAVGSFVLEPAAHGFWLRRDIPHLPVVFSDRGAAIGPIVEPGTGPCLYCLERYRTDADPAWPAIASQLWGRQSSAETLLASAEVAAIVTRLAVRRLADGAGAVATSTVLTSETGDLETLQWQPHPDCGCVRLPSGFPPGTGSPPAPARDVIPLRPRTSAASASPA